MSGIQGFPLASRVSLGSVLEARKHGVILALRVGKLKTPDLKP